MAFSASLRTAEGVLIDAVRCKCRGVPLPRSNPAVDSHRALARPNFSRLFSSQPHLNHAPSMRTTLPRETQEGDRNQAEQTPANSQSPTTITSPESSSSSHSRTPEFLKLLHPVEQSEPTLQDLDVLKPRTTKRRKRKGSRGGSTTGEVEEALKHTWDGTHKRVNQAFTRPQLMNLCLEAHLGGGEGKVRKASKAKLVHFVLTERFGLKDPKAKPKEKERLPSSTKVIQMSSAELFLLLGRDGSDLSELSNRYRVGVTLNRGPLGLKVRGQFPETIEGLEKHLELFKDSISSTSYDLPRFFALPSPLDVPPTLLQNVSRLSRTFIEPSPLSSKDAAGTFKISYVDERHFAEARRLLNHIAFESIRAPSVPLLAGLVDISDRPPQYSMFPFTPSDESVGPLAPPGGDTFRIKRVTEYSEAVGRSGASWDKENQGTEGIAAGEKGDRWSNIRILSLRGEQTLNPLEVLAYELKTQQETSSRVYSASLGHLIFRGSSDSSALGEGIFTPSLPGSWPFEYSLPWMRDNGVRPHFVPSVPPNPSSLDLGVQVEQSECLQLVYRKVLPSDQPLSANTPSPSPASALVESLHIELDIERVPSAEEDGQSETQEVGSETSATIQDASSATEAGEAGDAGEAAEAPSGSAEEPICAEDLIRSIEGSDESDGMPSASPDAQVAVVRCAEVRKEARAHVMIPDAAVELRLDACDSTAVQAGQLPSSFMRWLDGLHARGDLLLGPKSTPLPPPELELELPGESDAESASPAHFVLETARRVRRFSQADGQASVVMERATDGGVDGQDVHAFRIEWRGEPSGWPEMRKVVDKYADERYPSSGLRPKIPY